jgi:hypothetical protein
MKIKNNLDTPYMLSLQKIKKTKIKIAEFPSIRVELKKNYKIKKRIVLWIFLQI